MISKQQFLLRQPSFPDEQPTDEYYWQLSNKLLELWTKSGLFTDINEEVRQRACLGLAGYYQDIIVDAGIWHAFINENRRLHGRLLPFYDCNDDNYLEYELNRQDVEFLLWYYLAMLEESLHLLDPHDHRLLSLAALLHGHLDAVYDESPMPVGYKINDELEFHAEEDQEAIFHLGHWIFYHCYLMTPAFALNLSQIVDSLGKDAQDTEKLQKALGEAMNTLPTGPLALFVGEWTRLIVEDRTFVPKRHGQEEPSDHPYFTKFTAATGGKDVAFFGSYQELNQFLKDALGWDRDTDHLTQLRDSRNFVLMVNRKKGMLVARNVAEIFDTPDNPYYNREFASTHAILALTDRGFCPCDLALEACRRGWLPDARFHDGRHDTVARDFDFIARCYLQQYYRD